MLLLARQPLSINFQQINLNNSEIEKLHFGDITDERANDPELRQGNEDSFKFNFSRNI